METDVYSSPNKRQKCPTSTLSPLSSSKGKEKIEEIEVETKGESIDSDTKICGICFTEEGEKSIRGWIDICNHFFCFVCIMEWSKVESRCPMCKQRFKSITRKPKDGVALQERIVNVPVRNQVWDPLGNQTTELSDPYSEVNCIECHTSEDDHLLLLCDLCDSAAHTYCVGWGVTVPEGDWYCHDCTVSRDERSNSEIDSDPQDSSNSIAAPVVVTNASISEIVQEPYSLNFKRSMGRTSICPARSSQNITRSVRRTTTQPARSSQNINRSRRRTTTRPDRLSRNINRSVRTSTLPDQLSQNANRYMGRTSMHSHHLSSLVLGSNISLQTTITDSSARTLSHCRNVHNRIQVLREHWNALRNGSLGFSTNSPNPETMNDRKRYGAARNEKTSKPQSSSSTTCKENATKDNAIGDKMSSKGSYDIDRAWKMLDIAKSVQRARECTQSSHQVSNHQPGKQDISKIVNNTGSTSSMSRPKRSHPNDLGGSGLEKDYDQSVVVAWQNHKVQNSEERRPSMDVMGISYCQRLPSPHLLRSCELPLGTEGHVLLDQVGFCQENSSDNRASLNLNGRGGDNSSISNSNSSYKPSDLSELCASSCSKEERSKEAGTNKTNAKIVVKKDQDAKCEVQSLVKLNLKLLSRNKQLGSNEFKEIARLATHTVLAACGLEHKASSVRPFPNSICSHNDQTKQLHKSSLMPASCRECFYGFVKDVVGSIMAEQTALIQQDVK